jgi:hypothetical protein
MSLSSAPFGFKAVRTLNGGDLRLGRYTVSSSSSRIFNGDVVTLQASTGLVVRRAATDTDTKLLGVAAQDTGVIAGQITNFPVYDDPSTVYQVQGDNSTAITQAKFGNPFRIVATTGDTSTGRSKEAIGIKTATAASASNIARAIRLVSTLDGNDLTAYSLVECVLAGDPTKLGRSIE